VPACKLRTDELFRKRWLTPMKSRDRLNWS